MLLGTQCQLSCCCRFSFLLLCLLHPPCPPPCSLQSETAVEGARSRTDVTVTGDVAVLGSSRLPLMQLSGREEEFAFRRAVSDDGRAVVPGCRASVLQSGWRSATVRLEVLGALPRWQWLPMYA